MKNPARFNGRYYRPSDACNLLLPKPQNPALSEPLFVEGDRVEILRGFRIGELGTVERAGYWFLIRFEDGKAWPFPPQMLRKRP